MVVLWRIVAVVAVVADIYGAVTGLGGAHNW